jgi:hypothetical protein
MGGGGTGEAVASIRTHVGRYLYAVESFLALAHVTDATLKHLCLHFHRHLMLRYKKIPVRISIQNGSLRPLQKWVFIGHFVVRPPCKKVQGPLQL